VLLRGRLVGASRLVMSGELNGQQATVTLVGANVVTARSVVLGDESDSGSGTSPSRQRP
jgi:hypothetical protein